MAFWDGARWIREAPRAPAPTPRRTRDFIATGLIVLGLVALVIPQSTIRASGLLELSPETAPSNSQVEISGSGLGGQSHVAIIVNASSVGLDNVHVNGDGTFRAKLRLKDYEPGVYNIAAMQVSRPGKGQLTSLASSTILASAILTVVVAPAANANVERVTTPSPSAQAASSTPPAETSSDPTATGSPTVAPATPSPTAIATTAPTPQPATAAPTATPPPTTAPPNPPISGFVRRSGTQLTLNGQPYRFTGFNIYNANSRWNCWYPMVGGGLDRALSDIGSGQEVIRAWFFQSLATTNGQRDWSAFDATLATARAHNVRVIVTLADHWGACEGTGLKGEGWYTDGYRNRTYGGDNVPYREFVRQIVSRYANDPTILMWQMVNEAESKRPDGSCSTVGVLTGFATDIGGLIKGIDGNHLVSLGTMGGGQCATANGDYQTIHALSVLDVCEVHDYWDNAPMPGDQWNGLAVRISQCNALGKPIFVGEMGRRPQDAGGTIQARASIFAAKFAAQFSAGIDGILVWGWRNGDQGGSAANDYDVGPGDPTLAVVKSY